MKEDVFRKFNHLDCLEFQVIYDKLDIEIIERGESFYQKHMEALVKDLDEKGR